MQHPLLLGVLSCILLQFEHAYVQLAHCFLPAVSLLTAFWEAITPVSILWGAILPLFLAWILYDRPFLSPIVVTLILMAPFKFPPGYNVRLI